MIDRPKHEHVFIAGSSQTGKSTLLRNFCRRSERAVIIYDPTAEPCDWENGWRPGANKFSRWFGDGIRTDVYTEVAPFMAHAKVASDCDVFVDEAADVFAVNQNANHSLVTQGRHRGLTIYMASQRLKQVSPNVRGQCARFYFYRTATHDLRDGLSDAGFTLKQLPCEPPMKIGECITVDCIGGVVYSGLWVPKKH